MKYSYLSKFDSECGASYRYHFTPPSEVIDSDVGRFAECSPWSNVESGHEVVGDDIDSDCVIVGGGLSAVTMGSYLFHAGFSFKILDPNPTLAFKFGRQVFATGQRVMRSPYEHFVGCQRVYDYSLLDFAKLRYSSLKKWEREQILLATAGHRSVVPVDIFMEHLAHQIRIHQLHTRHVKDRVIACKVREDGVYISLASGRRLKSFYVIYATGESVRRLVTSDHRVVDWDSLALKGVSNKKALVVGAGQTAANVTEMLINNHCTVDLAFRARELRFRCVDSTPHLFRPAGRIEATRTGVMTAFPSSIMIEYEQRLKARISQRRLRLVSSSELKVDDKGTLYLDGRVKRRNLNEYDVIVPCLGLEPEKAISSVTSVNPDCSLTRREFVIGARASAAVGPVARNIDGHRVAAERVTAALLSSHKGMPGDS